MPAALGSAALRVASIAALAAAGCTDGGRTAADAAVDRTAGGDGRAERREHVAPVGGTGIEVRDGHLYLDQGSAIVRWRLLDGTLRPAGTITTRRGAGNRSAGRARATDGSILVADDTGGRIYRLSYIGTR